jgi:endonuclease-3
MDDQKALRGLRSRYRKVAERLVARYGHLTWTPSLPPVDELVNTILSQSTTDWNRDLGFARLRERLPTWEAVRDAPTETVIDAIRPAGLASQKGPRIQEALRTITAQQGAITLDFLANLPLPEAKAYLTRLHGIGPKTAAIILCFAFNRPAFPVDRHVHRVVQRIGLIGAKTTPDQAHDMMEAIVPNDQYYEAHLNLIRHGREICHASNPECERCPLTHLCDYYQKTTGNERT